MKESSLENFCELNRNFFILHVVVDVKLIEVEQH